MSLIDRILGSGNEPKIPIHQFSAALCELTRGKMTRAEIITAFAMVDTDITQLDVLLAQGALIAGQADRIRWARELEEVMELAEGGYRYVTPSALRTRLGF